MRTLRVLFLPFLIFTLTTLAAPAGTAQAVPAAPVDINSADAQTLAQAIKGIGPAKAAAIVAYRQDHGPFKSVDDLTAVKGIGQALIDANRETLTVKTDPPDAEDRTP